MTEFYSNRAGFRQTGMIIGNAHHAGTFLPAMEIMPPFGSTLRLSNAAYAPTLAMSQIAAPPATRRRSGAGLAD